MIVVGLVPCSRPSLSLSASRCPFIIRFNDSQPIPFGVRLLFDQPVGHNQHCSEEHHFLFGFVLLVGRLFVGSLFCPSIEHQNILYWNSVNISERFFFLAIANHLINIFSEASIKLLFEAYKKSLVSSSNLYESFVLFDGVYVLLHLIHTWIISEWGGSFCTWASVYLCAFFHFFLVIVRHHIIWNAMRSVIVFVCDLFVSQSIIMWTCKKKVHISTWMSNIIHHAIVHHHRHRHHCTHNKWMARSTNHWSSRMKWFESEMYGSMRKEQTVNAIFHTWDRARDRERDCVLPWSEHTTHTHTLNHLFTCACVQLYIARCC